MDYTVGDTIYFKFTTRAFATGIPTTLAGSPVLSVYEDASVTQITAGVSITADLDSVAGLNLATIVATGGNGFETGKHYAVVITTGTVSAVSVVGEVIGQFTLEKSAAAIDLANATDGLGAIKTDTAAILVDTGTTIPATIADVPTVAEFNARTLAAADYFDPATDAVANVTLVATTTANTDMRGTDSAATAAALATVDTVVDAIKVKTDSLTFTTAGEVDANIQSVNDIVVTGNGETGTEWGPV